MAFFTGLVQGVNEARQNEVALNFAREQQMRDRENRVFNLLSTSSDPEIQAMALTGMMTPPPTSSKGAKGFVGIPEPHPAMLALTNLLNTPKTVTSGGATGFGQLPSQTREGGSLVDQPGGPGNVPLPAGSTTAQPVVGAGQPPGPRNPLLATAPQPGPEGMSTSQIGRQEPSPVVTSQQPRELGITGPEIAGRQAEATAVGSARGLVRGLREAKLGGGGPESEGLIEQILLHRLGGVPYGGTDETYEIPGQPGFLTVRRGRAGGTETLDGRPINLPENAVRVSAGATRPVYRSVAGPDGSPRLTAFYQDGTRQDMGPISVRDQYMTVTNRFGDQESISVPAVFQHPEGVYGFAPAGTRQYDVHQNTVQPGVGSTPQQPGGAAPGVGTAPPTPAPTGAPTAAPGVGTAPPGVTPAAPAGQPGAQPGVQPAAPSAGPAPTAPTATAPATAGGAPGIDTRPGGFHEPPPLITRGPNGQVTIQRGIPGSSWELSEGTVIGVDGTPHEQPVLYNKKTAEFLDPDSKQPMGPNFVPGKLPEDEKKTLTTMASTMTTIQLAMQRMQELGLAYRDPQTNELKGSDDPQLMNDIARDYYLSGKAGNTPQRQAFAGLLALEALVTVQGAQPYLKGSRAYPWILQIQGHLPNVPKNLREATMASILGLPGTGAAGAGMGKWDPRAFIENPIDSPMNGFVKMEQAMTTMQEGRKAVLQFQGAKQRQQQNVGQSPTAGAPAQGYQVINGEVFLNGQKVGR